MDDKQKVQEKVKKVKNPPADGEEAAQTEETPVVEQPAEESLKPRKRLKKLRLPTSQRLKLRKKRDKRPKMNRKQRLRRLSPPNHIPLPTLPNGILCTLIPATKIKLANP